MSTVVRLDLEVQTDAEKNSYQPGDALFSFPRVGENAKCPEMSVYSMWHINVEFCCFSLTTKQQLTGKFLALLSKGCPGTKTEWRLQATGVQAPCLTPSFGPDGEDQAERTQQLLLDECRRGSSGGCAGQGHERSD